MCIHYIYLPRGEDLPDTTGLSRRTRGEYLKYPTARATLPCLLAAATFCHARLWQRLVSWQVRLVLFSSLVICVNAERRLGSVFESRYDAQGFVHAADSKLVGTLN